MQVCDKVKNLLTFMRYSSAAYGQTFLRILGMGKGDVSSPSPFLDSNTDPSGPV